jgi:hypothetical protein
MDCKKDGCIVLYNECGSRSVVLHVLLLHGLLQGLLNHGVLDL